MRLIYYFALLIVSVFTDKVQADLSLPTGFKLSIFASDVENARQMSEGPNGIIFVGSRKAGLVHALVDENGDYIADKKYLIDEKLTLPSGLIYHKGDLYVAALDTIYRYPNIADNLQNPPEPELWFDDLPDEKHHGWKYLKFSKAGNLIVPIGAPCNICDEKDERFSTIASIDPTTKTLRIIAHGVRNSVGFDFSPITNKLWFTDNGRDWLGDDEPPCELNRLDSDGEHFGFPYIHGGRVKDPKFGRSHKISDYKSPELALPAHVAPLGMTFYSGDQFPVEYRNNIIFAEHGSWNRSEKVGYRVMMAKIKNQKVVDYTPFLTGFLTPEKKVIGRPVDVLQLRDGSLLISDDFANKIYRVSYSN